MNDTSFTSEEFIRNAGMEDVGYLDLANASESLNVSPTIAAVNHLITLCSELPLTDAMQKKYLSNALLGLNRLENSVELVPFTMTDIKISKSYCLYEMLQNRRSNQHELIDSFREEVTEAQKAFERDLSEGPPEDINITRAEFLIDSLATISEFLEIQTKTTRRPEQIIASATEMSIQAFQRHANVFGEEGEPQLLLSNALIMNTYDNLITKKRLIEGSTYIIYQIDGYDSAVCITTKPTKEGISHLQLNITDFVNAFNIGILPFSLPSLTTFSPN